MAAADSQHVYRRRIRLTQTRDGLATGELEDDFHHFVARVEHRAGRIVRVGGESPRVPWSTCPGALAALASLDGVSLSPDLRELARAVEPTLHCTHWLDAALLAAAWAARPAIERDPVRVYDVAIPEPEAGTRRARLTRNGQPLLEWEIEGLSLREGGPLGEVPIVGTPFRDALDGVEDLDTREAVLVLRRAVVISLARVYDMDRVTDPRAFGAAIGARCHTFQPQRSPGEVRRNVGANRDFTNRPDDLLGLLATPAGDPVG